MRRFFIEKTEISDLKTVLKGSEAKHIKDVLRLKVGDTISLFNGIGSEYDAKIKSLSRDAAELSILREYPSGKESPVQITLAQALLKDRKMDTLVRQLTELGMTRWIPFISGRSVPKPDKKRIEQRRERWIKIAQESLKQCRRGNLPEIEPVASFDDIIGLAAGCDIAIIFWEEASTLMNASFFKGRVIEKILLVIGPEGGFAADEINQAVSHGFISASLGPRILKADTAPVAACAIIQYLCGDLGDKSS